MWSSAEWVNRSAVLRSKSNLRAQDTKSHNAPLCGTLEQGLAPEEPGRR